MNNAACLPCSQASPFSYEFGTFLSVMPLNINLRWIERKRRWQQGITLVILIFQLLFRTEINDWKKLCFSRSKWESFSQTFCTNQPLCWAFPDVKSLQLLLPSSSNCWSVDRRWPCASKVQVTFEPSGFGTESGQSCIRGSTWKHKSGISGLQCHGKAPPFHRNLFPTPLHYFELKKRCG